MAAPYYFRKYFSPQFVLEPTILKQIDSELHSFLTAQGISLPVEYRVFKESGGAGAYVTSRLEKLLADPNSKGSRISSLIIQIGEERHNIDNTKAPIYIECRFSKNYVSRCKVEIQDYRSDQSQQQIADRLCELFEHTQRDNERSLIRIPSWLKGSVPPLLTFFLILLWLRRYPVIQGIKLGDLSVIEFPLYALTITIGCAFCFLIWKLINFPKYLDAHLPTTGIFLWGAEVHDYRRRSSLRENLTWGIGVAFIVGIAASLMATWMS
jgi:hypothetical protein